MRAEESCVGHVLQVVKLCVQVLVEISQGTSLQEPELPLQGTEEPAHGTGLSSEEAESYRSLASAVRSMANKLDSDLIKVWAISLTQIFKSSAQTFFYRNWT